MNLYQFVNSEDHLTHFESGNTVEEALCKVLVYTNDKNVFHWKCYSTTENRILHPDYTLMIMYSLSMAKAMREAWL